MNVSPIVADLEEGELLCVVGTTASDKTKLAIRICEQVGGEVIGADSVQIYRYFDIGSGKPTAQERSRARHHLVDVADPLDPVNASRFASWADDAVREIRARGRVPIVCGGTFLWVKALVYGLADAPQGNAEIRARLEQEARAHGREALHARLRQLDPITAARLSPNDFVRVQRALEVVELTGQRLSDLHAQHQTKPPKYAPRFVGVKWAPDVLEQRIRERADTWLRGGWVQEVEALLPLGFRESRPMGSVGYRQILEHVEGQLDEGELLGAIVRATKVFARRQRTWLREVSVRWIEPD